MLLVPLFLCLLLCLLRVFPFLLLRPCVLLVLLRERRGQAVSHERGKYFLTLCKFLHLSNREILAQPTKSVTSGRTLWHYKCIT